MTNAAPDCATNDGAKVWLIKKDDFYYRANRCGYTKEVSAAGRYARAEADREAAIEPWHMSVEREPEPTVDVMVTALRSARELIACHRDNDLECFTVNGDPATMDESECSVIAEYEDVLDRIDAALATRTEPAV